MTAARALRSGVVLLLVGTVLALLAGECAAPHRPADIQPPTDPDAPGPGSPVLEGLKGPKEIDGPESQLGGVDRRLVGNPVARHVGGDLPATRILVLTEDDVPIPGATVSLSTLDHVALGSWATDHLGLTSPIRIGSVFLVDVRTELGMSPSGVMQRPGGVVAIRILSASFLLTVRAVDSVSREVIREFDVSSREMGPWREGTGFELHLPEGEEWRATWYAAVRHATNEIARIPVGPLRSRGVLELKALGYTRQSVGLERVGRAAVRFRIGQGEWRELIGDELVVPILRSQALAGQVIDERSGVPIPTTLIALDHVGATWGSSAGKRQEIYTDAFGRYQISDFRTEAEVVAFLHPGYAVHVERVSVLRAQDGTVRLHAGFPFDFVIETQDGTPAAGASLELAHHVAVNPNSGDQQPSVGFAPAAWQRYAADDHGVILLSARSGVHMAGVVTCPDHASERFVLCASAVTPRGAEGQERPRVILRMRQAAAQSLRLLDPDGEILAGLVVRANRLPAFLRASGVAGGGDDGCGGVPIMEWDQRPVVPAWLIPTAITDAQGWARFDELPIGRNRMTVHSADGSLYGQCEIRGDGQPIELMQSRQQSHIAQFVARD